MLRIIETLDRTRRVFQRAGLVLDLSDESDLLKGTIRALHAAGASVESIALTMDMTPHGVLVLCREMRLYP